MLDQNEILKTNKINENDESIHSWYRFVLAFPPHLVRYYLKIFNADSTKKILDPFCGTGTTNIECMKEGYSSIGIEANPMTYFASYVKTKPILDEKLFILDAQIIKNDSSNMIKQGKTEHLTEEEYKLLIKGSIDEKILSDVLILKKRIDNLNPEYKDHYYLAIAKCLISSYSNLKFSPEVSVVKNKVTAVDVPSIWFNEIMIMLSDYSKNRDAYQTSCVIINGDAREITSYDLDKVDIVITSPPYPNEKDYSRATRLETIVLGLAHNKSDLREIKKQFIRSNTKTIYKNDDDSQYVLKYPEIVDLSNKIENRRIELNKTSGFEKLYSKVLLNYFGGMARHLISLKTVLNPGAKLAYVVGDQASYYQIPIKTAELLAIIAKDVGYKVERIDTFRTRFATASGEYLNENVLILSYSGGYE